MIFHPDLAAKVLDGSKTQTRRRVKTDLGGAVTVGSLTREDARREGFRDPAEFYARWREMYGEVFGRVWRIEFELVVNGEQEAA